jgi:GNAT superfamily N-acetyltransferase
MRSKHIAMPWEEFEVLPRAPGWKYEYWDGTAHITPNHRIVVTTVAVSPRIVNTAATIRPAVADDEQYLKQPFMEAFAEAVDYCDYDEDGLNRGANRDLERVFKSQGGNLFGASLIGLDPAKGTPIGAVLVTEGPVNPLLSILFVVPRWQRNGIADALVSAAINCLDELGEGRFTSAFLLANEASRDWHHKFGFIDEPDLSLAQNYLSNARHELWRRQKLGNLSAAEQDALEQECGRLERDLDRLRELEDREGSDAVNPVLRFL